MAKNKYRIIKRSTDEYYVIQFKSTGLFGLFDYWSTIATGIHYNDVVKDCEEYLKEDKEQREKTLTVLKEFYPE